MKSKHREVTIHDIARAMNVAPSTISRALHNSSRISEATREKVYHTARELGYHPNIPENEYNPRKTKTIGIVVPDVQEEYTSSALAGIQKQAANEGFRVQLNQADNISENGKIAPGFFPDNGIDGLIVSLPETSQYSEYFNSLIEKNIPVAFFHHVNHDIPAIKVFTDHFNTGYQATRHLISGGNTKIALINGHWDCATYKEQQEGYKEALQESNLSVNTEYIKNIRVTPNETINVMNSLLNLSSPPHALITPTPYIALQIMNFLHTRKIKIPQEFSLISIGDSLYHSLFIPSVSAVQLPSYQIGKTVAECLINQITTKQAGEETVIKPARLIIRKSSLGA